MVNPFIKNKKIFSAYLFAWMILVVIQSFILYYFLDLNIEPAILDSLVYNFLYFALGISVWYTAQFNSIENYSPIKITMNHFVAAAITSGLWVLAGYYILTNIFDNNTLYKQFLNSSILWRCVVGILFYSFLVAIDYVIIYYNNFHEKVLKEAELKGLVKEAELKTLKYQINPHFIFNSLNSISSLTTTDPAKAQEMTIKLSGFLRSTLSKNEKQMTKLQDEINAAKLYLDIEKIRFGDKFDLVENISQDCCSLLVPNMILQPLFENAVKHGVYESLEKVIITLRCTHEGDYMKISIENNYDPEAVSKKGEGIGLLNIKNRLKLIFNQDNLLTTHKTDSKFEVNIFIPMN